MKTFLVKIREKTVVINNQSYYYNNIISVKDNDIDTLEHCNLLVKEGKLEEFDFAIPTKNSKKETKPKKDNAKSDKSKDTKSKDTKNKNNEKEEK